MSDLSWFGIGVGVGGLMFVVVVILKANGRWPYDPR